VGDASRGDRVAGIPALVRLSRAADECDVVPKDGRAVRLHGQHLPLADGTHGSHEGDLPDARAIAVARSRGYDLSGIRSRPVVQSDFERFHYVLGMDNYNLRFLQSMKPPGSPAHVIDDPYYGGPGHFDTVLERIQAGADGLLAEIRKNLR
jgi:hypothetical protein